MNIKKLGGIVVGSALLLGPVLAFANTTATSSVQVQAMLVQIQALQAQIQALKTAQGQVQVAAGNVSQTLGLIRNLKQGMSGDDVKALQAILAADPSIYPQGVVSGFFGKLTSEAVRKFQKKHGLEMVGFVGPKTLKKLHEEKEKLGLSEEDEDEDGDNNNRTGTSTAHRLCAKVPPGHLIAPGWLKKNGNIKPVVPACQTLPPGIMKKLDGDWKPGTTTPPVATTTPEVLAPIMSSIGVNGLTSTTTNIVWTTNEFSNSRVWFGTTTPVTTASSTLVSNTTFVLTHTIPLPVLATSTTYYYMVGSTDASGNTATSSQSSFVTLSI